MKALLLLVVLAFGIWLWRSGRKARAAEPITPPPPKPLAAVEMVACAHCGVHCALPDSIEGRHGRYCSSEHRRLAEH